MKRITGLTAILLLLSALFAFAAGEGAPEWADVELNELGFLDEGEYVLEDPETAIGCM